MTEEEFKSLGPKYNLYYSRPDSTLSFKSDSTNPAFVVAYYNENGFVQVYPECLGVAFETDDNLEIATSGVTKVSDEIEEVETYIKEFWTNYKNTVIKFKKSRINKDFENDKEARPSIH